MEFISSTTPRSRVSHASSRRKTTSTHTSAGSIRMAVAAAHRSSPISSSARDPSSIKPRRRASSTSIVPSRACVRSMQNVDLPQIGAIEISIIDEDLPRLLEFERGGLDVAVLRGEVATRPLADNKLRPEYVARGVTRAVFPEPFVFSFYFNAIDPMIGGLGNDRVALRRAVALAIDTESLVKIVYAGQALPANQIVPPGVGGHDPAVRPKSLYDPATAKALLDRFGYKIGADGFRTAPDGKPLTLTLS